MLCLRGSASVLFGYVAASVLLCSVLFCYVSVLFGYVADSVWFVLVCSAVYAMVGAFAVSVSF